jgi:pimeloyl-ACP methyl ester carboxylesterase
MRWRAAGGSWRRWRIGLMFYMICVVGLPVLAQTSTPTAVTSPGPSSSSSSSKTSTPGPTPGFLPCADADKLAQLKGSLCTLQTAPLDHGAPASAARESLQLFVRKFPATTLKSGEAARGQLWLVSGGPGESGASLYPFVGRLQALFPGLDLLVPDHRGTGYSSRICPKEEAPQSPGGTALVDAEWASCFGTMAKQPGRTGQFNISNAARDLQQLLWALAPAENERARQPVYLYAVSYGTQLVLRALHFGPLPVKAVIFDSLVPLETDALWDLSRRSFAVDDVGRQVLGLCDANASCRKQLVESSALTYRRVLDKLSEAPGLRSSDPPASDPAASEPAASGPAPRPLADVLADVLANVPGKSLPMLMGGLLDWPAARARIPDAITELEAGQDTTLKAAQVELQKAMALWPDEDPQLPASVPLASLISASENNQRPELTGAAVRQAQARLLFTSPLPELLAQGSPTVYARDKSFGKQPKALPPLLIFSGSLDPKTHHEAAAQHVAALRPSGAFTWVSVQGAPHFVMWTAPDCFAAQVKRFLSGDRPTRATCVLRP